MGARILIVEDDPDILRLVVHAVSAAGYEAFPAYGGDDAVHKVKTRQFDLVLTDLAMPAVSGVELIESIKQDPATRHIPVIAVTAHAWDTIAQSARQVGCDGFLSKPFTAKQLAQEIEKHLRPAPA
jgi:CheY-like chemotaxis protein